MLPLSFKEYISAKNLDFNDAWKDYYVYGGLPRITYFYEHKAKENYLTSMFKNTYKNDILERNQINYNDELLEDLIQIIASSIGFFYKSFKNS